MRPKARAVVRMGQWWHSVTNMPTPWGIFWRGLLLLLPWAGLLLFCLLGILLFRLWTESRASKYQTLVKVTKTIEAPSGTQPLILEVYHSKGLLLDPPNQATPSPVFLRLYRAIDTSLVAGQTPSPPTEVTTTPIPRPTSTLPSYHVSLQSAPGLTILDEEGQPLPDPLVITPAPQPGAPVVAYLAPTHLTPGRQVIVNVSAIQEGELSSIASLSLELQVENSWLLLWRRLSATLASTPAILTAVIGALLGLAVQQWKYLEDAAQEHSRRREAALKEIRELGQVLQRNLSEGARKYLELRRRPEAEWQETTIKQALEEVWQMNASELQLAVKIIDAPAHERQEIIEERGQSVCAQALAWALDNLDETWREKVIEVVNDLAREKMILLPGLCDQVQEMLEQKVWSQYPSLTFWREMPYYESKADVRAGVDFLGLEGNPFGASCAEEDSLLKRTWIEPLWMQQLRQMSMLHRVMGPEGVGKTAVALLFSRPSVGGSGAFNVYWPAPLPDQATVPLLLQDLARTYARIVLAHIAVLPKAFLRLDTAVQIAVVRLWLSEMTTLDALRLRLYETGLPREGDGAKVLELITHLAAGVPQDVICPKTEELPQIMAYALPHGYNRLAVWLNGQETLTDSAPLKALEQLIHCLHQAGITVRLFLPKQVPSSLLPLNPVRWQEEELQALLRKRLGAAGEESVASWCQPDVRGIDIDGWLVHAAEGCPGRMITLGNALLSRIGKQRRLLSHKDLESILGTYP